MILLKHYAKKLKSLRLTCKQDITLAGCFLLSTLVLTGCAQKPWGDPFTEDTGEALKKKINQLIADQQECISQWDADLEVNYHTAIDDKKFDGYILVEEPSSFKFIASNPLGQPLLAVTTNGNQFQLVDVLSSQYTHGSTMNFAVHNNVPTEFISGQWGNWLAAKIDDQSAEETVIYSDENPGNFWYATLQDDRVKTAYLFDASTLLVKTSLVLSEKGKTLAAFHYTDYVSNGSCLQPTEITIDQLSFGASITLRLTDIQPAENTESKDFRLTVPSHYFNRYLP